MLSNLKLGERLSILRQSKELTQKDLAKQLNVSDKTVSKWETSENEPSISDLTQLSIIFNVSLDLILRGTPVNESDNNALQTIQNQRDYINAKKELDEFFKVECPNKDRNTDEFFIIKNNKIYAIFDAIISLDNLEFFNKVNEKYTFVQPYKYNNYLQLGNPFPHPYKLTLDNLKDCDCIELLKFVVEELKKEYANQKRTGWISYGEPITIDKVLSDFLNDIKFNDVNSDAIYEKVVYLIDQGAYFYKIYQAYSDYHENYVIDKNIDYARTNITYKLCKDNLKLKNELDEIKKEIRKLKNK